MLEARPRRLGCRRAAWALCCSVLAASPSAFGQASLSQGRGLDPTLYRAAVDADGYLSVDGTQALRQGQVGLATTLDAAFGLSHVTPKGSAEAALVDRALSATLSGNLGLGRGALIGFSLPFLALSGDALRLPGTYDDAGVALSSKGLGALQLHSKWSFHEANAGGLGVAGVLRSELPTGDSARLRGGPGVALWPAVVVEYMPWAQLRAGVELGYRWVEGRGAALPTGAARVRYDDQLRFGLGVEWSPSARWSLVFDTAGSQIARALGKSGASALELSLGAKYRVTNLLSVVASGAWGPLSGLQGATARATLGLSFAPGSADLDGDGLASRDDACPSVAEDFDGFEDGDGCPEPDNDRDGVLDAVDTCINDPEDHDGVDDHDGCPERAIGDSDGDGLDDYTGARLLPRSGR